MREEKKSPTTARQAMARNKIWKDPAPRPRTESRKRPDASGRPRESGRRSTGATEKYIVASAWPESRLTVGANTIARVPRESPTRTLATKNVHGPHPEARRSTPPAASDLVSRYLPRRLRTSAQPRTPFAATPPTQASATKRPEAAAGSTPPNRVA